MEKSGGRKSRATVPLIKKIERADSSGPGGPDQNIVKCLCLQKNMRR
jgi:hypothetical protein